LVCFCLFFVVFFFIIIFPCRFPAAAVFAPQARPSRLPLLPLPPALPPCPRSPGLGPRHRDTERGSASPAGRDRDRERGGQKKKNKRQADRQIDRKNQNNPPRTQRKNPKPPWKGNYRSGEKQLTIDNSLYVSLGDWGSKLLPPLHWLESCLY